MKQNVKYVVFLVGCLALAVVAVLLIVTNILALTGLVLWIVRTLIAIAFVIAFVLLLEWAVKKEATKKEREIPAATDLAGCRDALRELLRAKRMTPYFQNKLESAAGRLDDFSSKCDNVKAIISQRFGSTGLSAAQFASPVTALQDYMVSSVNGLIAKLHTFNDVDYDTRISEFKATGKSKEVQEYSDVETEYKDAAQRLVDALDDAVVRLDKLALEISKLSDADADKAAAIMQSLDDTIKNTALYK